MLRGTQVRVRYVRDRIEPVFVGVDHPETLALAERLIEMFRGQELRTRGELQDEIDAAYGDIPGPFLQQGLAKLLEDRCDFEVIAEHSPEELRQRVFGAAETARAEGAFDRSAVLASVAMELQLTPEEIDAGLFADLKSEQRLVRFKDITPTRLLQRYNVALTQSIVLRATAVTITVRGETPTKLRRLLRLVKFHRLICAIERLENGAMRLQLDGPLSLFSATQKYGLQLAMFLPGVLQCADWDLLAELRWGPQRKPKRFALSHATGLVSHLPDHGAYVPHELKMFARQFQKKEADWRLHEETDIIPLGNSFWVPDFRLEHIASKRSVFMEVLGYWRKSSAELHIERLHRHAESPFLLAVSDQLRIDDDVLEQLPAEIVRFRQMPLPNEIARRAAALLGID